MIEEEAFQRWDLLSDREREVAWLVRRGFNNDEIGPEVGLDAAAVEECLQAAYRRLGVGDPLELALFIAYHGLAPRQAPQPESRGGRWEPVAG